MKAALFARRMRAANNYVLRHLMKMPFRICGCAGNRFLDKKYAVRGCQTGEKMLRSLINEIPAQVRKNHNRGIAPR